MITTEALNLKGVTGAPGETQVFESDSKHVVSTSQQTRQYDDEPDERPSARDENSTGSSISARSLGDFSVADPILLLEYEGVVNEFDSAFAHVTLTDENGDQFEGRCAIEEFTSRQIGEGDVFLCRIEQLGPSQRMIITKRETHLSDAEIAAAVQNAKALFQSWGE